MALTWVFFGAAQIFVSALFGRFRVPSQLPCVVQSTFQKTHKSDVYGAHLRLKPAGGKCRDAVLTRL